MIQRMVIGKKGGKEGKKRGKGGEKERKKKRRKKRKRGKSAWPRENSEPCGGGPFEFLLFDPLTSQDLDEPLTSQKSAATQRSTMIDESHLVDLLAPIIRLRLSRPNVLLNPVPDTAVYAWFKNPRDLRYDGGFGANPRVQALTTLVLVALGGTPLPPRRRLLWLRRIRQVGYFTPEAFALWEAQERAARDAPRLEAEARARAAVERERRRQAERERQAERIVWHAECRARREAAEQRRQARAERRAAAERQRREQEAARAERQRREQEAARAECRARREAAEQRRQARAERRAAAERQQQERRQARAERRAAAERQQREQEAARAERRAAAERQQQEREAARAERRAAAERQQQEREAKRQQRRQAQANRAVLRAVEKASRPPRPRLPGRRVDADERALDVHWRTVRAELQLREHRMWREDSGKPPPMITKKWGSLPEGELIAEVARARAELCALQKARWERAMADRPPGAARVRRPQWMVDEAREAEIEAKNSRGCFVPRPLPRPKQPKPRRNYEYERRERQVDHTRQSLLAWFHARKKRAWIVGEWKVVLESDIPYATRRAAVVEQLAPLVITIRPPWRRQHERYRCFRLGAAPQAC